MNQYDGEVDDEFDYEIQQYRQKKAKRQQKLAQSKNLDNFEQMENLLKRRNFAETGIDANNVEKDFSKFFGFISYVTPNWKKVWMKMMKVI